ncbi:Crp/Fnr family transcriptional regulator [Paracoccus sp. TOH]|uniref:Crp/Fnr family transcriptional regulator n=1 Tax=Paracoccus sp. TOH TaxID=1263728 RepID=UPI0025AFFE97|nr:Crp/Fnr family transcriptional regulator [Paracoccus sp. TOH]WJS83654.1 Crp/Fnr family transcriptional regulator [Paracoccus sp. TOH]
MTNDSPIRRSPQPGPVRKAPGLPPWFQQPGRWESLSPDLIEGLGVEARLAFYAECTPRVFPTPTEILSQDEETDVAYLIIEGQIEVSFVDVDGNTVIAHVAGPGEVMGEIELLSGKTCAASCRTLPNTRLLCFTAPLLMRHVPLAVLLRNFAGILHGRLVRDNRLQAIAQFYSAEGRICMHLLRMTTTERPEVQVSQSQLALLAGCSRQTVNRTLAELRAEGIIEQRRGLIRVRDPGRLSARRLAP